MATTEKQLHLLHHTLGVTPKRREPYRNHFVASEGHHDMPDLKALEAAGMMARSPTPAFCHAEDIVFHVTAAGRAYALDNLAQPPKLSKYQEYLEVADCYESFAAWLGIEVPRRQYNYYGRDSGKPSDYVRLYSSRATGDFCRTIKEAKASYKAKLAAQRAQLRG